MRHPIARSLRLTSYLLFITGAAACSPPEAQDPIASLSGQEPSSVFGAEYWDDEARKATATWKEAVLLCARDSHRTLPNCRIVAQILFLEKLRSGSARTSKPYDGQGAVPLPEALERVLAPEATTPEQPPTDTPANPKE